MPSAYQILNQLANILYLTVYMLMFASIIRLRYTQPDRPRPFRLGKGKTLVWIIAGAGFLASLVAYAFSFIPPDQISIGSPVLYVSILVVLALVFYAIPNIIYQVKKPEWKGDDPDFAPFTWQADADAAEAAKARGAGAAPVAAAAASTPTTPSEK